MSLQVLPPNEHLFRIVKQQLGYAKVRYRGLGRCHVIFMYLTVHYMSLKLLDTTVH